MSLRRLCAGMLLLAIPAACEECRAGAADSACGADAADDADQDGLQLLQLELHLAQPQEAWHAEAAQRAEEEPLTGEAQKRTADAKRVEEEPLTDEAQKRSADAKRAEERLAEEARKAAEACSCYAWNLVYANTDVHCGSGNEIVVAEAGGVPDPVQVERLRPKVQWDFCDTFYKVLDTEECASIDYLGSPTGWKAGTWCYVSATCSDLGMGAVVPDTEVAWKTCGEQDAKLRDRTIPDLAFMAQRLDLMIGLLVKMAYPNVAHGMDMRLNEQVSMQREEPSTPLVFDSKDHHPPFRVVDEDSVYEVRMAHESQANLSHPSTLTTIRCVSGCGLSAEVLAVSAMRL